MKQLFKFSVVALATATLMSCGQTQSTQNSKDTSSQQKVSSQETSSPQTKTDDSNLKVLQAQIGQSPYFSPEQEKFHACYDLLNAKKSRTATEEEQMQDALAHLEDPTRSQWDILGEGGGYLETSMKLKSVSSTLKPEGKVNYEPKNLFDNLRNTAWVEGAKGQGIGEYIELSVPKKSKADAKDETIIDIFNGYSQNPATYKKNSRVKKIKLYVNGQAIAILDLQDTPNRQTFDIEGLAIPKNVDLTYKFEILDVYKGDKYEDTAITELNLGHHVH